MMQDTRFQLLTSASISSSSILETRMSDSSTPKIHQSGHSFEVKPLIVSYSSISLFLKQRLKQNQQIINDPKHIGTHTHSYP